MVCDPFRQRLNLPDQPEIMMCCCTVDVQAGCVKRGCSGALRCVTPRHWRTREDCDRWSITSRRYMEYHVEIDGTSRLCGPGGLVDKPVATTRRRAACGPSGEEELEERTYVLVGDHRELLLRTITGLKLGVRAGKVSWPSQCTSTSSPTAFRRGRGRVRRKVCNTLDRDELLFNPARKRHQKYHESGPTCHRRRTKWRRFCGGKPRRFFSSL